MIEYVCINLLSTYVPIQCKLSYMCFPNESFPFIIFLISIHVYTRMIPLANPTAPLKNTNITNLFIKKLVDQKKLY